MNEIVLASASPRALRASQLFCDELNDPSPITKSPHVVTTLKRTWMAFTDGVSMVLHAMTRAEAKAYAELHDAEVENRMNVALFDVMKAEAKLIATLSTTYVLDWVRLNTEACPVCKGERCIPGNKNDVKHLEHHTGLVDGVPFDRRRIDQVLATADLDPSVEVWLAAERVVKPGTKRSLSVLNFRFTNSNLYVCGLSDTDNEGPELVERTRRGKGKAVQHDAGGETDTQEGV